MNTQPLRWLLIVGAGILTGLFLLAGIILLLGNTMFRPMFHPMSSPLSQFLPGQFDSNGERIYFTATSESRQPIVADVIAYFQKHYLKLIALLLWFIIVVIYWGYASYHDLSPLAVAQHLSQFLRDSAYGPLIFLTLYLIRPLIFFPSSVVTLLAGFLFGPVEGLIYSLSGSTATAIIGYLIGCYFGQDFLNSDKDQSVIKRWTDHLHRNSFETILIMRLIMINHDLVSYVAGLLRVDWKAFLGGTMVGSLTGVVAYVLAGAAIEGDFSGDLPSINPWLLGTALLLGALSLIIAWYLRWRNNGAAKNNTA